MENFLNADLSPLLSNSLFGLANWKWLALSAALVLGLLLRPLFQSLIKSIRKNSRKRFSSGTGEKKFWTYLVDLPTDSAVSWIALSVGWLLIVDSLQLPQGLDKYLTSAFKILLAVNLIRFVYIAVDAVGSILVDSAAKTDSSLDDQLAPFASKTLKVLVVALGVLISLQNLGVNVMSLLAGLGLGGLALALAAQDTAANLFGSITILMDAPFKIGDHVKIGDVEGTIDEVGFRSTRIRTVSNSLVTIPNSIVAKDKIENLGLRNARRSRQVLGLAYETPPEKINLFCDELRYLLQSEPLIQKDTAVVTFNNFNSFSLDVLVVFHIDTADLNVEHQLTQKVLCDIWKIAEKLGVEFAYPTQKNYLIQVNSREN